MSSNHGRAQARESAALEWLAGYDPEDGYGAGIGWEAARDTAMMFTQPVVIDAFTAGGDLAETRLEEAAKVITEAAALFMGYADHHRSRADGYEAGGNLDDARDSLRKAAVNMEMTIQCREWLAVHYGDPTSPAGALLAIAEEAAGKMGLTVDRPAFLEAECRLGKFAIPAEIADNGDLVPITQDRSIESCRARFSDERPFKGGPNIRPVTHGPMSDTVAIDALVEALGGPARSLSTVRAGAFRLQTPDPRFDPAKPVTVNGYLYTPTTEA